MGLVAEADETCERQAHGRILPGSFAERSQISQATSTKVKAINMSVAMQGDHSTTSTGFHADLETSWFMRWHQKNLQLGSDPSSSIKTPDIPRTLRTGIYPP